MRSEIVEHDDVVGLEGWDQKLLDIGEKALAVDRTVEHAGRVDAVVAQRGEECRGLPFALRDLVDEALAARSPAVEPGHVGLGPGLVDEHQPRNIDALLVASPTRSMARYVRTILLARDERLFLSVTPRRRKKRLIIEVSALTPRSASNRSQSALRVMSDFSRSQRFEKFSMRLKFRTEVSAHLARRARTAPLEALHPFDCREFAHPKPRRSRSPAHPSPNHRVDHPVAQILRICMAIPAGLRPASKLNQNNADLLADLARSCATMRALSLSCHQCVGCSSPRRLRLPTPVAAARADPAAGLDYDVR